jgi:MFS family permease
MDLTLPAPRRHPVTWLWRRELVGYPGRPTRLANLAIVVLATVVLYYQFYLAGSLAAGTSGRNGIIPDLNMSFVYYTNIAVGAAVFGAVSSFLAGAADRFGRANIVTVGLLLTALLCLVGIPLAHSKGAYAAAFIAIGFVEGFTLVATPALVRDFSPQVGRAKAMGFWAIGPVLGSLVVSVVVSNSSESTPWRDQYTACGVVGLVAFLVAAVGLRELAPELRDQIMVSERDRALVEARAKGLDVAAGQKHPVRQMLKPDIIGSALAISFFLIFYYVASAFLPVFFQTALGYSQSKANTVGNWFWAFNAVGLLVIGFLSDRFRVRKPFMLVGAVGAAVFTAVFAVKTDDSGTSFATFVVLLVLVGLFMGIAYVTWMAGFTETVEARNPMLTATGLGVWGVVVRVVVAVSIFIVPHVVNTVTTLVDHGGRVQELAAGRDPALNSAQNATVKQVVADPAIVPKVQSLATTYSAQLATAQKLTPSTTAALQATPGDQAAQVQALSEISGESAADVGRVLALNARYGGRLATAPAADLGFLRTHAAPVQTAGAQLTALSKVPPADLAYVRKYGPALRDPQVSAALTYLQKEGPVVRKAAVDSPKQWQRYFWICVGGEILFIPFIFLMVGYWDPRKARQKALEHDAWVQTELADLRRSEAAAV